VRSEEWYGAPFWVASRLTLTLTKKMKFLKLAACLRQSDLDSDRLAHTLTMAGLEVEALESVAPPSTRWWWRSAVAGEASRCRPLNVCRVNIGAGEPLQIVCGGPMSMPERRFRAPWSARNCEDGDQAGQGACVESSGMLCSESELDWPMKARPVAAAADATVGQSIRDYLGLDDKLYTSSSLPTGATAERDRRGARSAAVTARR